MSRPTTRPLLLALLASLFLAGCCARPCAVRCAPVVRCATPAPVATVTPVERAADAWIARARAAEPAVTALLKRLVGEAGGEMVGLEHRLKSRTSTISKIERLVEREPGARAEEVEVYDALRYTMRVNDEPPGHHDDSLRAMLAELEAVGHTIDEVKNYWPRGDTYNGVNCRIRTSDGLPWELQFHTRASYAMKETTHDDYERMRESSTPPAERRSLFDAMVELVDTLPIPDGILEPKSLHGTEELRLRPSPAK